MRSDGQTDGRTAAASVQRDETMQTRAVHRCPTRRHHHAAAAVPGSGVADDEQKGPPRQQTWAALNNFTNDMLRKRIAVCATSIAPLTVITY